eukprot:1577650-Alexandrium_andersonii.AAC.1
MDDPTPFGRYLGCEHVTGGAPAGVLFRPAARVLMKVLHAAWVARPDLLKAVCPLASNVNRWTSTDAERLHRM